MNHQIPAPANAPLVIGATGGSGTRVAANIAQRGGYFFGTHLNGAQDALEFLNFHDRWINRLIHPDGLSDAEKREMREDFYERLRQHLGDRVDKLEDPGFRWGWKAPRTIYLLPFLHEEFPGLKYIHILRDGRDMAFSKNQNQLRRQGKAVLSWRERWFLPLPVRSILLWDRVNLRAAEYADATLGQNYLTIRFEDLCQDPVPTTQKILNFLEMEGDAEEIARAEIRPPASIGRWRSQPAEMLARMETVAAKSLGKFGYLTD